MVPDGVQTGCENGCSEREQKLKGRRLNEPLGAFWETFDPLFAENASEDDHSEWVI